MTAEKFNAAASAPSALLVSALSETIAPIAVAAANAVISLSSRLGKRQPRQAIKPGPLHAPHVAMVMVPGNFVTEPFLRR